MIKGPSSVNEKQTRDRRTDRPATNAQFCVQTWTIRRELSKDPTSALRTIQKLGATSIEVGGSGSLTHTEFGKLCTRLGLEVYGVHHAALDSAPLDQVIRDYCKTCKALKTNRVVVAFNPHNPPQNIQDYQKHANLAKDASSRLADNGIHLAYHCYTTDLLPVRNTTLAPAQVLIDNVNHSHFSLQLDTFFANRRGLSFDEVFGRFGHRCSSVHLNGIAGEGQQTYLGSSEDTLDWKALSKTFKTSPTLKSIIEHKTDSPFEWIQKSIQFATSLYE